MLSDLIFAIRQLGKSRGFTATVIVTLALGIGACTVVFSVVNSVLLHSLTAPEPDRLVTVRETRLPDLPDGRASVANFTDWKKQTRSFISLAALAYTSLNFTGEGEPLRLSAQRITANYYDVLGVKPALGRPFLPEEETPGKNRVVILSHSFWQTTFGGSPDVMDRSITRQRFAIHLLGLFSFIALVIIAVDIYGVIAYTVGQRTTEIGIRMALGAQVRDILRLVLVHGARLVGLGVTLGLVGSLAAGRFLRSQLFQTSPNDPLTLITITVLFAIITALACWLPARRATKIDPLVALRTE